MKVKPLLAELYTLRDQWQEKYNNAELQWKRDMDIYLAEVRQQLYNALKYMESGVDWDAYFNGDLDVPWEIRENYNGVHINLEVDMKMPRKPDHAWRLATAIRLLERTSQEDIWVEENGDIDRVIREHL